MATWHQNRNQDAIAALWRPEPGKFKCITDKHGQPASCMVFDNLEAAQRYCEKTGDTLICPPKE